MPRGLTLDPMQAERDPLRPLTPEVEAALVENHRKFLSFLERRTHDRARAEDILQSAYSRAIERGVPADDSAGTVNWFFAVLKNALADHYRHRDVEARAMETLAAESPSEAADAELRDEVCACFRDLLPTLHPYAEILEKVDFGDRPVSQVAAELGITANNASVRLHRARGALRKQLERSCGSCATHGCLECSCGRH